MNYGGRTVKKTRERERKVHTCGADEGEVRVSLKEEEE